MPGMTGGSGDRASVAPRWSQLFALLGVIGTVGVLWLLSARLEFPREDSARVAASEPQESMATETRPELWVDPATARIGTTPSWADPRWIERLQARLAEEAPFPLAHAAPALERLRSALAGLSFVECVERLEAAPDEGLVVDLQLRKPVACIPVAGEFALVGGDGIVLEGRWPFPPRLGRAYLPVLGPLDDPLFARARAGDWLVEPEHTDALDVARSLAADVPEEERAALGRVVIDARAARQSSVSEPGVRLELEGGRMALYGRAPSADEPGELAPAAKWRGLVRAFDWFASDPLANDWRLVDLRWDRPDLELAQPNAALAQPAQVVEVADVEPDPVRAGRSRRG